MQLKWAACTFGHGGCRSLGSSLGELHACSRNRGSSRCPESVGRAGAHRREHAVVEWTGTAILCEGDVVRCRLDSVGSDYLEDETQQRLVKVDRSAPMSKWNRSLAILAAATSAAFSSVVVADPEKNESGKGREGGREQKQERDWKGRGSYFHQHGYTNLRIPEGHLPPPGECRVWYPDRPPGQQPPPVKCGSVRSHVPSGAWLITREGEPQYVDVVVYDPRQPSVVIDIGVFDVRSGALIRGGVSR